MVTRAYITIKLYQLVHINIIEVSVGKLNQTKMWQKNWQSGVILPIKNVLKIYVNITNKNSKQKRLIGKDLAMLYID